ncbi:MAG: nucleoside recognition protein [Haloferacaceae archaeon]
MAPLAPLPAQAGAWPVDPALLADVLVRVVRIAAFVAGGVFLANVAVAMGAVERIAGLSGYLTGPANLPDEVGTAILTTAASTTAGYGMLAEFRESGALDDRATLVAVTINTFFGFVQHVFTYYVPVLIPILGVETGVLYVGTRAAIALGITLAGVLGGAVLLSPANVDRTATVETASAPDGGRPSLRAAAAEAWERTVPKLRRIVPRLAVVYAVVAVLVARLDLRALTAVADPLTAAVGLPGAAVPVIAVFAFDTTAGAATIAPLLGGTFTPRTAVATMLVGGIISFAVSTFKRSIPFQYGIWGPAFGSKVIAVNTALKVAFIGAALAVLLAG